MPIALYHWFNVILMFKVSHELSENVISIFQVSQPPEGATHTAVELSASQYIMIETNEQLTKSQQSNAPLRLLSRYAKETELTGNADRSMPLVLHMRSESWTRTGL